jgi:TolA-binding protein
MDADVPESEDANFFYAVSFFRQENWARTRHEFKHLLGRFPSGRWAASAHWHLAICDVRRGRIRRARIGFRYVMRRFPSDPSTVEGARNELRRLGRQHDGVLIRLWDRVAGR